MKKSILLLFLYLLFPVTAILSQTIENPTSSEIMLRLKKLKVLSSVLYVAAHPDDENTVMLSWLCKEKMMRTSYLSITRGDGGQNLIGAELGDQLGLIRTNELLAARAIDGPEQYFTRANDFGFSKNTEETLQIWGKEAVLGDVVWRIRSLRPDVIICRFPPDSRAGHGNHSASAVLAEEAFKISNDPTKYPEQLKYVKPWQAKRVVWNTFNFGAASQVPTEKSYIKVEIGNYNTLLGKSYPEIAAESRSQHKSQGFGVPRGRGSRSEYFVHKAGENSLTDGFDGINQTWSRLEGAGTIDADISDIIQKFNWEKPSLSVPALLSVYYKIGDIKDDYWKAQKQKEIKEIIVAACGLWFEVNPTEFVATQGETLKLNAIAINRSDLQITLKQIKLLGLAKDTVLSNQNLANNFLFKTAFEAFVPENQPFTQPFWLAKPKINKGMYTVDDQLLIGLPTEKAAFTSEFTFDFGGQSMSFEKPILYKYTDETRGELYRSLQIRPAVTVNLAEKVLIFTNNKPNTVLLTVKNNKLTNTGELTLSLPNGWLSSPKSIPFTINGKFQEAKFTFEVTPTLAKSEGILKAMAKVNGQIFDLASTEIKYDHIPPQILYSTAEAKILKSDLKINAKLVGYIEGAGDDVPKAIAEMGTKVQMLGETDFMGDLSKFDAIVVGIRAYNVNERMKVYQPKLMKYVENGGKLIVQYQVNSFLQKTEGSLGPFPLKISRDRVTVEEAEVRFLKPESAILNVPNKITQADFNGWVQERGLYFANEWDAKYEAVLSSNDPDEKALDGGLLVGKFGKGTFIFTGYAFFRQLPAGVPGAFRLFANMISK